MKQLLLLSIYLCSFFVVLKTRKLRHWGREGKVGTRDSGTEMFGKLVSLLRVYSVVALLSLEEDAKTSQKEREVPTYLLSCRVLFSLPSPLGVIKGTPFTIRPS